MYKLIMNTCEWCGDEIPGGDDEDTSLCYCDACQQRYDAEYRFKELCIRTLRIPDPTALGIATTFLQGLIERYGKQ